MPTRCWTLRLLWLQLRHETDRCVFVLDIPLESGIPDGLTNAA